MAGEPTWTTAYFTGVRPGHDAGHYCFLPGFSDPGLHPKRSPWPSYAIPLCDNGLTGPIMWPESHRDGMLIYSGPGEPNQPEGRARVRRKDGWTLVFLWDRSGDRRGNSSAGFAFDAELTDEDALREVRMTWPTVIDRIEKHLGRAVVLDGEVTRGV